MCGACVSYEEEDTCVAHVCHMRRRIHMWRGGIRLAVRTLYEEEDTCVAHVCHMRRRIHVWRMCVI
jgi:acyl-coenzyme A thioesterase PaaI-like protein